MFWRFLRVRLGMQLKQSTLINAIELETSCLHMIGVGRKKEIIPINQQVRRLVMNADRVDIVRGEKHSNGGIAGQGIFYLVAMMLEIP